MARPLIAGWLRDPAFDLTLIFGITALACLMGGIVWIWPAMFVPLLALHTWCFGFDHVIATFTKLVGLPEDRRRNWFLIWVLPPLAFGFVLTMGVLGGVGVLATGYFFYQWFHTTRQSWGVAQHYRRAAGGLAWDPPWLSELTLWSIPVAGVLHRCAEQHERFLFMPLYLPRVPLAVVFVTSAIAAVLVVVFAVTRWLAWRRGELSLPHTLYFSSHLFVFSLAYLVVPDLHAGWLLVNVWHNVQYLAYVWMHNRGRFASGVREDARILSWLCQPGWARGVLYFAGCLLISTPLFAGLYAITNRIDDRLDGRLISMTLVLALAVNLHHYIVDGLIWKRARTLAR